MFMCQCWQTILRGKQLYMIYLISRFLIKTTQFLIKTTQHLIITFIKQQIIFIIIMYLCWQTILSRKQLYMSYLISRFLIKTTQFLIKTTQHLLITFIKQQIIFIIIMYLCWQTILSRKQLYMIYLISRFLIKTTQFLIKTTQHLIITFIKQQIIFIIIMYLCWQTILSRKQHYLSYLISRFLIKTTQTRKFPMMLIMMNMAVDAVMAISATSDMTDSFEVIDIT